MTDRLSLTRALEGGGINSEAAERIATEIYDAIHDNVATKDDLERVRTALGADLERVKTALGADIAQARSELDRVETALRVDIADVRSDLEHKIDTMVNRVVAAIVVAIGSLFAALHYWPPHA